MGPMLFASLAWRVRCAGRTRNSSRRGHHYLRVDHCTRHILANLRGQDVHQVPKACGLAQVGLPTLAV